MFRRRWSSTPRHRPTQGRTRGGQSHTGQADRLCGPTREETTEIGGKLTVEPVGTDTRTTCALLHASRVTGNPLRPRVRPCVRPRAQGAGRDCRASDPEAHPAAPQRQTRRIAMHLHDVRSTAVAQLTAAVVLALGGVAPVWAAPRHPTHPTHPTIPAAAAAAEAP